MLRGPGRRKTSVVTRKGEWDTDGIDRNQESREKGGLLATERLLGTWGVITPGGGGHMTKQLKNAP